MTAFRCYPPPHIVNVEIAFDGHLAVETSSFPYGTPSIKFVTSLSTCASIDAHTADGNPPVEKLDKTTPRVAPSGGCATVRYQNLRRSGRPLLALNLATTTHSSIGLRYRCIPRMRCAHLTQSWLLTLLQPGVSVMVLSSCRAETRLRALLPAPTATTALSIHLSSSALSLSRVLRSLSEYNVVVHADPADYNMETITSTLQTICFDDYGNG